MVSYNAPMRLASSLRCLDWTQDDDEIKIDSKKVMSCYDCKLRGDDYYICNYFKNDKYQRYRKPNTYQKAVCCKEGDDSPECTPSESNKCSPLFKVDEMKDEKWLIHCPSISDELCGGKQRLTA